MRGGPIQVNGDGRPYRSYLYAADLAIWLWTILFKGEPCRPCNVGSDEAISIAVLARSVVEAIAPAVQISIASSPQPLNPSTPQPLPARYVPDTTRAQRELNLHAWTGLRDAIQKTARWHGARI